MLRSQESWKYWKLVYGVLSFHSGLKLTMIENDPFTSWLYTFIVVVSKVFLLVVRVWKIFITWLLNLILGILLVWPFNLLGVQITVSDFGFLKVQGLYIAWKKNKDLSLDVGELKVRIGWSLRDWRNLSVRVYVTKIKADFLRILNIELEDGSKLDGYLSAIITWKVFTTSQPTVVHPVTSAPYSSVMLVPEFDILKTSFFWFQAKDVCFEIKMEENSEELVPVIVKTKKLDVVIVPMENHFVIMASAANIKVHCRTNTSLATEVEREEKIIDLEHGQCLACWAFHGPNCFSYSCHSLKLQIMPEPVELVFKMIDKILRMPPIKKRTEPRRKAWIKDDEDEPVEPMVFRLLVLAEEITISFYDRGHKEFICVNGFLNCFSDHWRTKIKDHICFGVSAEMGSLQNDSKGSKCLFIGEKETLKMWSCKLTSLKRPNQSSSLTLMANNDLILVLNPNCFKNVSAAYAEFNHLFGFVERLTTSDKSVVTVENLVHGAKKHKTKIPNQQVELAFKGLEVCLQMNEEEKVAIGTFNQIEVTVTKFNECVTCKFSVIDFELMDCVLGGLVVTKRLDSEQKCEPLLQVTIETLANEVKTKISFKNLYGKLSDLIIVLEEEFLYKLLQFGGVEKSQLWGLEEQTITREQKPADNISVYDSDVSCKTRCYFERLELEPVEVVLSLHRSDGPLPDELQELKNRLEIPKIMPPQVDKAKVKFACFLRTKIYYRSPESVLMDVKRHYLKEVGLQSAKILGSLHLLGNVTELKKDLAEGFDELKETGDYATFMRHMKKGLSKSYQKFTDSWTVAITGVSRSTRSSVDESMPSSPGKLSSPGGDVKQQKGQEFLRRLKIDLDEPLENEQFLSCLKLRYESTEDRLNAVISSHTLYLMRVGPPTAQQVVLHLKFQSLLKAQHKCIDDQHYIELVTRLSGTKKLSIASCNPADSPLVRCDSKSIACRASEKLNEAIKKFDELQVS